eukprot:g332.t1
MAHLQRHVNKALGASRAMDAFGAANARGHPGEDDFAAGADAAGVTGLGATGHAAGFAATARSGRDRDNSWVVEGTWKAQEVRYGPDQLARRYRGKLEAFKKAGGKLGKVKSKKADSTGPTSAVPTPADLKRKKQGGGADLSNAVAGGRFDDVVRLLDEGADPNNVELRVPPLHYCVSAGDAELAVDIARYLVWNTRDARRALRNKYTAAMSSASKDKPNVMDAAVGWAGDIDEREVASVTQSGTEAVVTLDTWHDPDRHAKVDLQCGRYGATALHVAASGSASGLAVARFLIGECGARLDIPLRNNGITPLDKAIALAINNANSSSRRRYVSEPRQLMHIGGKTAAPPCISEAAAAQRKNAWRPQGGTSVPAVAEPLLLSAIRDEDMLLARLLVDEFRRRGQCVPSPADAVASEVLRQRLGVSVPRRGAGGADANAAAGARPGRTAPLRMALRPGQHPHQVDVASLAACRHPAPEGAQGAAAADPDRRLAFNTLTAAQVEALLCAVGLAQHARDFARHEIDGAALAFFEDRDLEDIGVALRPKRLALLQKLDELKAEGGVPARMLGAAAGFGTAGAGRAAQAAHATAMEAAAEAAAAHRDYQELELFAQHGRRGAGRVKGKRDSDAKLYWGGDGGAESYDPADGVAATSKKDQAELLQIVQQLRKQLKQRGARGMFGLSRKFRIIDDDNSKSLDFDEFSKAMRECALVLDPRHMKMIFGFFDADNNGSINFNEFLNGVREPMSERRRALVREAFRRLDADGNGLIEVSDLVGKYRMDQNPDVLNGRKDEQEVLAEFIDNMSVNQTRHGKVTPEEWMSYYQNVGNNIDSDDEFELMIRNAWHISGGQGWCANTANTRVLMTHADGRESVEEIRDDLGVGRDQYRERLERQGVRDIKDVGTTGWGSESAGRAQHAFVHAQQKRVALVALARSVAMADDSIDQDRLNREALYGLLCPNGAGASGTAADPHSLPALEQAWLAAVPPEDSIECTAAATASRTIWQASGGVPLAVQQSDAWQAAAGLAAEAMAEEEEEDDDNKGEAEGKTGGEGIDTLSSNSDSDGGTGCATARPVRHRLPAARFRPADEDARPQRATATRRELLRAIASVLPAGTARSWWGAKYADMLMAGIYAETRGKRTLAGHTGRLWVVCGGRGVLGYVPYLGTCERRPEDYVPPLPEELVRAACAVGPAPLRQSLQDRRDDWDSARASPRSAARQPA